MNDDNKNQEDEAKETKKTVTTTITCKFCGKPQEVTIEIPESAETPKMVWND